MALLETKEGAKAFDVADPFIALYFNFGSYLPKSEHYYTPKAEEHKAFAEAVVKAAKSHPLLVLQYAAYLRDPKAKGNRSQPPWLLANASTVKEVLAESRYVELVAKCVVRPDDALAILQASIATMGRENLPENLFIGLVQGLARMKDYQLAKYSQAEISLGESKKLVPDAPEKQAKDWLKTAASPKTKTIEKTIRFSDMLGVCQSYLDERLHALYAYLHAPTRLKNTVLDEYGSYLPLQVLQRGLMLGKPKDQDELELWLSQAALAKLTIQQILSAVGSANNPEMSKRAWVWITTQVVRDDEDIFDMPMLPDLAFLRNVRAMVKAGVEPKFLIEQVKTRQFKGVWPYQIRAAMTVARDGATRGKGKYVASGCPEALPVFDAILEKVGISTMPHKPDGSLYRIMGLADVSGSMTGVRIGGAEFSTTTCRDVAVTYAALCGHTLKTDTYLGLAGTFGDNFGPVPLKENQSLSEFITDIEGGPVDYGTQIFASLMSFISYLESHPEVPRPEVLIAFSDMQFHPADTTTSFALQRYKPIAKLLATPEFANVPPLAAALVLYRRYFETDLKLVLWNLATNEGSPTDDEMQGVLLMSGFDANSFKVVNNWLNDGGLGAATATPDKEGSIKYLLEIIEKY